MPGWTWHTKEEAWEEAFDRLSQYVQREGSAFVPTGYEEDGFRLGQWATVQRRNFAKGKLNRKRQKRLAALPGWTWDALEAKWEEGFERLSEYVRRRGSARVTGRYEEDGFRLGQWISVQRSRYANGKLEPARKRRLAALPGWTWDANEAAWQEGFDCLVEYVQREGSARVPTDHQENGFALGRWVRHVRSRFAAGQLSRDRQKRLEALPGWDVTDWRSGKDSGTRVHAARRSLRTTS
jgi:hypothetical protein